MSFAILVYGVFNLTFQTFKSLHKRQRYSVLIDEYNEEHHGKTKMDGKVVLNRLDKDEMIPLLKLWTVLAFIQFYESYLDVFFSWIPFFAIVKMVVFAFIVIPQTRGGGAPLRGGRGPPTRAPRRAGDEHGDAGGAHDPA